MSSAPSVHRSRTINRWANKRMDSWRIGIYAIVLQGIAAAPLYSQTFDQRYDPYGQGTLQRGWSVEASSGGGYLVFGTSPYYAPDSTLHYTVFALHLDTNGVVLGEERMMMDQRSLTTGWSNASATMANGDVVLAGYSYDQVRRPVLYRFSGTGDSLALFEYTLGPGNWSAQSVRPTADGGFIVCGHTDAVDINDAFLLKLDSLGAQQWLQTYGAPGLEELAISVELGPGGGYVFGGTRAITSFDYDQWVVRTDALGTMLWSSDQGTPFDDGPEAHITTAADGHLLFASGWCYQGSARNLNGLVKLDTAANVVWSRRYGQARYDQALQVVKECANGDLVAAGVTYWPNEGYQGVLLRTNSVGDSLWLRHYYQVDGLYTDREGYLRDVIPVADGGFVAVGTAFSSISGNNPPGLNQDVWVLKVDSMGCIQPGCDLITGLHAQVTNFADALTIAPNPAARRTTVRWALPERIRNTGGAQLALVSALGRLVNTWPCDLSRGSFDLDLGAMAPGLYHLHLVQNGTWITGGKVVVE